MSKWDDTNDPDGVMRLHEDLREQFTEPSSKYDLIEATGWIVLMLALVVLAAL